MTAEREPEWHDEGPGSDAVSRGWSVATLLGRMRLGEPAAFEEYIERYGPLLREMGMRYGGIRDFGESVVSDVLHDVAESIRAHRVPRDVNLGPYLIGALRRHIFSLREARDRHDNAKSNLATQLDGDGEHAITSTVSAYSLRATRPSDDEVEGAHDAMVRRFHAFVRSIVTEHEWLLLGWKSERVFGREMALWTGASHGSLRTHLHRLCARIVAESRAYLTTLDAAERTYIERRYLDRLRPVKRRKRGETGE